jgi:hypothetical protein
MIQMDDYRNRLAAAKAHYPFRKWAEWGIDQHTHQALDLFVAAFNQLRTDNASWTPERFFPPQHDPHECLREPTAAAWLDVG